MTQSKTGVAANDRVTFAVNGGTQNRTDVYQDEAVTGAWRWESNQLSFAKFIVRAVLSFRHRHELLNGQ